MPLLTDSLATRLIAIILGGFLALALVITAIMAWPRNGDVGSGLFQLPVPEETEAIVEALEAAPPAVRPLIVRALNTSVISVRLDDHFPPLPLGLKRAPGLEWMFRRYSGVLQDRAFRVDVRQGLLPLFVSLDPRPKPGASVQMSIRLRDGAILVIQRRPGGLARNYMARSGAVVVVVSLILLASLALAVRQTARPVQQLARAARSFSLDGAQPDLPIVGPGELRALAVAMNEMQHRIRGLVDERTRLLAAIAHDLRTYLTRMRLRVEFIEDREQQAKALGDIVDMGALLDDTLLFIQQGRAPSSVGAVCDASAEVADYAALRIELGDKVSLASPPPGVTITCSALTLRRMLGNLTDNALRYAGGAQIAMIVRPGWADILVEDEGPGVPETELNRIMLPFERLEPSRARATGGAGLGLSIVKALAEGVGGALRIENRAGGGLRALLSLPRPEAQEIQ